jgi:hypothetical protein
LDVWRHPARLDRAEIQAHDFGVGIYFGH